MTESPTPQEQERLSALADRRRTVRMTPREHSHSAFVTKLRWILPVTAGIILAALLIWPKIETELAERRFAPSQLDEEALKKAATENRLLNANFSSVDSKGRPFTIDASEAVQKNDNPDVILLTKPKGTLKLDEDSNMTAESRTGTYAQAKQHLTMHDDVVLTRSDGTVMKTQILFIDMISQDARTDQPVTIEGPQGKLNAQGMSMKQGGAVTIFTGPAKLILNSDSSIDPKGKS